MFDIPPSLFDNPPMRLIGTLPSEADSRRFCDYLLTRGAASHFEEGADGAWQIWIEHDDQLDTGRAELDQFRTAPADPRYDASAKARALREQAERAAIRRRKNFTDVRTANFSAGRAIPATVTIIFIALIIGGLTKFGQDTDSPLFRALLFDNLWHRTANDPPLWLEMFKSISHGQLWRLITPIFIHFGPLHLVLNMTWMVDLGRRIEAPKGSLRFVLMVLVIAVLSCTAQAAWTAFGTPGLLRYSNFGGMSGVVAGLFGYAWMCGHFRPYERIGVSQYETGLMLGWLVVCTLGYVGPIANAAHWGGLLVGMAMGAAPSLIKKIRRGS